MWWVLVAKRVERTPPSWSITMRRGVLHLDDVRPGPASRRRPARPTGSPEEPQQQVEGVDGLVDQHAATGRRPAAAPGRRRVVGGVPEPPDGRPRAAGSARASPDVQHLADRDRGRVVPVLQHDADLDRRSRRRARPAARPRRRCAPTGFSVSTCDAGVERVQGDRDVLVVRGGDVHDVRARPRAAGRGGR